MDGVSGLEEGVHSIFPKTVVQRCIVHLIRNATKYIPSKYLVLHGNIGNIDIEKGAKVL